MICFTDFVVVHGLLVKTVSKLKHSVIIILSIQAVQFKDEVVQNIVADFPRTIKHCTQE